MKRNNSDVSPSQQMILKKKTCHQINRRVQTDKEKGVKVG